jgi:hypothetical protein
MKALLKRCRFQSAEDVKGTMMMMMMALTDVSGKGLQECFQQWYSHWQKYVTAERNYFEGGVLLHMQAHMVKSSQTFSLYHVERLSVHRIFYSTMQRLNLKRTSTENIYNSTNEIDIIQL